MVQMVSSVCSGNQVRTTKTSVSCLQSSMVVRVSLKQRMIPSLQRLGCRAVFPHDNDHCHAKEAEGKGDVLAKHVSRPKPY